MNTAQPVTGVYISHRTLQEHPITGIFGIDYSQPLALSTAQHIDYGQCWVLKDYTHMHSYTHTDQSYLRAAVVIFKISSTDTSSNEAPFKNSHQ